MEKDNSMTNGEALAALNGFIEIMNGHDEEMPVKFSYRLMTNVRCLRDELKTYDDVYKKIISKYGNGNDISPDDENYDKALKEINELNDEKIDIELKKISIHDIEDMNLTFKELAVIDSFMIDDSDK